MKTRLDKLLVDRGLARSRERAQSLILAGRVLVDEQKIEKAGAQVDDASVVRLLGEDLRYVSRGGVKLEHALTSWDIRLSGRDCMDVGASTGGFTDCMLQHGAAHVIAIDTGYGQIDATLRDNPRVRLMERTNARYLNPSDIPEAISFVAIDVAFISAALVLPAVLAASLLASGKAKAGELAKQDRELVVLVKPQFEVGRELIGKGGVVREESAQLAALERIKGCVAGFAPFTMDSIDSPILGVEGNREFLLYARWSPRT